MPRKTARFAPCAFLFVAALAGAALFVPACDSPQPRGETDQMSTTSPGANAGSSAKAGGAAESQSGVQNVFTVAPGVLSGSQPEGEAGFVELKRRGVKTIISVDGATPDTAAAWRHGMRYVHLPVAYHGIDRERQLELARAVRDLDWPVYIHCHHGKHRGPAAAASAVVGLGLLTPEQGVAFLHKAGTSESYPGLYACVRGFGRVSQAELDAASNEFPEAAPVPDFVGAMAQIDAAVEHLGEIRDAGWQAPAHHPDLIPLAEAGLLENRLRTLQDDPETAAHPADFTAMMKAAWEASRVLEAAIDRGAEDEVLTIRLAAISDSCKQCHVAYRNRR